jgi:hypothetical protein
MEHAVRTLLHLPQEIACAFFFAASIGIGTGVVAVSYTHRLGDGLKVAPIAFLVAAAGFGYAIWRNYRPERPLAKPQVPMQQKRASPRPRSGKSVVAGQRGPRIVGAKRARA